MSLRCFAAFLFAALGSGLAVSAEPGAVPLKSAIEAAREQLLFQCKSGDGFVPPVAMTDVMIKSGAARFLNCECMPQRLATIAASDAAKAKGTQADAEALMRPALAACGAVMTRKYFKTICEQAAGQKPDPTIPDAAAFCGCMAAAYGEFSDEQVVGDSIAMYRNYEAKVQALKEGKPKPPNYVSLLAPIEKSCRAKQPKAP